MKSFLTSVGAILAVLIGGMLAMGTKPTEIPRAATSFVQRLVAMRTAEPIPTVPPPADSPQPATASAPATAAPADHPVSVAGALPNQTTGAPAVPAAKPSPTTPTMTVADLSSNPQDWPKTVALKNETEFDATFEGKAVGKVKVRLGAVVDLISVGTDGTLQVQYNGAPKRISAADTDVLDRAIAVKVATVAAAEREEEARLQFNLRFVAVDGTSVDISRLHGRVVLVDFWATWCPPCMREVPNVVAAYRKYHDQGFEIIGISLDQDKAAMLSVTRMQGMVWPQYFDGMAWDGLMVKTYDIHSIPSMWLVNKKGVLVDQNAWGKLDTEVPKLLAE